jgi:hypothetical protein
MIRLSRNGGFSITMIGADTLPDNEDNGIGGGDLRFRPGSGRQGGRAGFVSKAQGRNRGAVFAAV